MTQKHEKVSEKVILEEVVIPFLREDLGYKLIDPRLQRIPVRFGRETKYADTVVYIIKNAKKTPHIVVETKAPGEALDWEQAESYAQRLGAPYFLVTDGRTWHWYQTGERQGESKKILNAPKPPAYIEGKVLIAFEDLNELSRVVGKCHDTIRNEEGFDPTIAFDEISKLLFAKMQDEKEIEQGFKDDTSRTPKSDYEFKIGKDELPEDVGRKVKSLFERAENKYPEIFEGMSEDIKYIKLRFPTIFHVVEELQSYTLQETSIDIKGATYEFFIKGTFMGRGLGQYFTPREIVEFMVDMVEPKRRHYIFDPACGSGGFLITCMDRVFSEIDELYRQRGLDNPKQEKWKFATQHLYGTDLNERMTWVAKMNMVMHGDGHGGIFKHDGFTDSERVEPIMDIVRGRGGFDIVLTNPPFGSKIKNQDILTDYELGKGRKTQLTEVLFIERCLKLLKPEGILGIVVPDGVLSNASLQFVRAFIKDNCVVKAAVSLPRETFLPYGSGVKGSLLFLQKKDIKNRIRQEDIFMANAEEIGYDATGRSWGKNELNNILVEYQNSKLSHSISEQFKEKIYWTKLEDLGDRLDVTFYHPKYLEVTEKLERSPYPLFTIGDISNLIASGATPLAKSDAYVSRDVGMPFIRIIDIKDGEIDLTNVLYIKREIHEGILRRSRLKPNDVLLSIAGTIGVATVVPNNIKEANINQALARIVLKDKIIVNGKQVKLNPYYIVAFLNSDIGRLLTERFSRPVVQANINLQEVSTVQIAIPPSEIQDKIADEVKRRQEESKKLKKEAEEIMGKAKKEVEKMIVSKS